jgi:DNA processing protein
MSSVDLLYWYWLRGIKNVGPARIQALVEHFGSPELAYAADFEDYIKVPTVGKELAKEVCRSKPDISKAQESLEKEALVAQQLRAAIMTRDHPKYPDLLRKESAVAPPLLYVRGSLDRLSARTVAVIGTREPSREGKEFARDFARSMASGGVQIISGLAAGIDAAAHRGALDAQGYTVAVLGCGVDRAYPPENKGLFQEILDGGGAIISEYPFGTPPKGDNLRKRNKIVVALSQAVVIAECPIASGTLIAANEAFEQVKPVFAVPFPGPRKSAEGSQMLLVEGQAKALRPPWTTDSLLREIKAFHATKVNVLFDLDGVLADATRLTRNALVHSVKEVTGLTPDAEAVKSVVHLSPRAALRQLAGSSGDRSLREFEQYWNKNYAKDLIANPQLRPMLEKLKQLGMPIGVVTSRNRSQTDSALDSLKLRDLISCVVTWGDTMQHKPEPEPIRAALKTLPDIPSLSGGDRPDDVFAAKRAGVLAVGASWFLDQEGTRQLEQAAPDHIVDQPSKLFTLILKTKRRAWAETTG